MKLIFADFINKNKLLLQKVLFLGISLLILLKVGGKLMILIAYISTLVFIIALILLLHEKIYKGKIQIKSIRFEFEKEKSSDSLEKDKSEL